ncbi:MAG: 1-(5-phosphoribosyl)-5-[(5-phosphoribosylamino)methylideneamino] imidazole-4-carboxamide isomerase [Paracoccaceae bacterium]
MIVYPMIELQHGRCVSLNRGRIEDPMIWHVDPIETARDYAAVGAEWIHLTDFDAIDGNDENSNLVESIIRSAGIPLQLGGGFRTAAGVERWIDKGAGRIVVGSFAAHDPQAVKELARRYPDQIVLSVDIWMGQVMVNGWRTPTAYSPGSYISLFDDAPFAAVAITDIESDVEDSDAQLGLVAGLAAETRLPVIANGIIRGIDDISRLKYVPSVSGVMVGRALFRKTFDLTDVLDIARPDPEALAEFI